MGNVAEIIGRHSVSAHVETITSASLKLVSTVKYHTGLLAERRPQASKLRRRLGS